MSATAPPPADLPKHLGKYEVRERLGQGAMGVVYRAHDPYLERDVALKVMLPQVAEDPEQKLRFEREARAVARMVHPHVVTVFDLGYHVDGSPYIAMELLRGRDLQQTLREGRLLSLDRKIAIIREVLEGLGRAHAAGIVHRDVKPANVFLTDEGLAKITDFGVARIAMSSTSQTNARVGTVDYMSPEQLNGGRVDGRSDLFSAGATFCEMLTGRRPFHGESLVTILFKIAHEEPRLDLPPGAEHDALLPILRKALAKDADDRYQTAGEFVEALRGYEAGRTAALAVVPAATRIDAHQILTLDDSGMEDAEPSPLLLQLDFGSDADDDEPAVKPSPLAADPIALFRLMREIHSGGRSGEIAFLHDGLRRSLHFSRGKVLHGTSDVRGEHLGDVLVRYGLLQQTRLDPAVETALREQRRLGGILLSEGLLDGPGLDQAVGLHAREILFDAVGRREGSFVFEETTGPAPEPDDAGSHLSTLELVLEAARRVQDPALVRQVLGDFDQIPLVPRDGFNRFRNVALTPADGFLLSRIDGKLRAREIFKLIPLPAEHVERSLFGLLCTGVVEYQAARPRADAPASPAGLQSLPTLPPPHPTAVSAARRDLEAERRREGEDRAVEATRRAIIEAYDGLRANDYFELLGVTRSATEAQIKEAYFRLVKPYHPDTRLDPRLADIQDKRVAVFIQLGDAYETLRSPESRARYQASLRGGPIASAPLDPTSDAAHSAWLALTSVALAEEHYLEGRYWDAMKLLETTIPRLEGGDKVRAQVMRARAEMKNPNWVRRAEVSLHGILQESPRAVEALLALGELYRATQLRSRSIAMYRRVLDVDPDNKDAHAALQALQGPDASDPGQRFKRLFTRS